MTTADKVRGEIDPRNPLTWCNHCRSLALRLAQEVERLEADLAKRTCERDIFEALHIAVVGERDEARRERDARLERPYCCDLLECPTHGFVMKP